MYVNFHTHTLYSSDGEQTPEALAATMAAAGVRFAALTDHDTIDGLARFEAALSRYGIPSLSGIELTTRFDGRIAHLVAYGFDPSHPELAATLVSLRQEHGAEMQTIAQSLRRAGSWRSTDSATVAALSAARNGRLEIGDAIDLLHRAGGRVFWAHPLVFEPDLERLDELVTRLRTMGLDGLEAIYAQFSEAERAALGELARKHDLLISAGTDFHGPNGVGRQPPGIDMPQEDWRRFRAAVLATPGLTAHDGAERPSGPAAPAARTDSARQPHRFQPRSFVLRIVLPTLAALGLFLVALWVLILPTFEQTLLDRKREMIQELTNSAWSILAAYQRDEQAGLLTRQEAQAQASELVQALRYGPDGRDYFWIQDTAPRMVMHPYRPDLDGQDLSGFTDPRGVPIFVEFSDVVEQEGEGTVDYVWQWFDDPERLEPKESYVKGFAPWDWIIGTGLYVDDVRAEIGRIGRDLMLAGLAMSGAIALLLLIVLQQSLRIERRRQEVVDSLHESTARYHSLVEATTEGSLLVLDGQCRYANPTLLQMLGYTARQLEFLELADILPREAGNEALWEALEQKSTDSPMLGEAREGCLTRDDGSLLECVLTLNPIELGSASGHILLARDLTRLPAAASRASLAPAAPAGVFRALAARRAVFLDISPVGRGLLAELGLQGVEQPALADLFADSVEFERVLARLLHDGEVRDHVLTVETPVGLRFVSLSAALLRDEEHQPVYIDGLLVDVTAARHEEAGREALIEKLQASLLFLHEPIAGLGQDAPVVDLDTPIGEVARQMTERRATAALVGSGSAAAVGIITDRDVRARVMAGSATPDTPVHAVMSAPLIRIPESALIYEALMRMEERDVRHLAVEDAAGEIVGVIDHSALIQFRRYGPIVLQREIARAPTVRDVAERCGRALPLAGSLIDSGARPGQVTSMLTSTLDAATERLIELSIEVLGPPPAAFVYMAMGSQGRGEVTLLTDQDNGIIFATPTGADGDGAEDYFRRLGAMVRDGLRESGYPLCGGQVMASEPKWCRSLAAWLIACDEWIGRAAPQDIADLSVLLDLRAVHGDADLAQELLRRIHASLPGEPAVLYQFSRNALSFTPPIRLPGNIYIGGPEHGGRIDLKDALMPIVTYARVIATRHRVVQTHTLQRIAALVDLGVLSGSTGDEVTAAYDFLMGLRLQTQLAATRAGQPASSSVEIGRLGQSQKDLLRQAFEQIEGLQRRIEQEFPGAG